MVFSDVQHGIGNGNYGVTFIHDSVFDGTRYPQIITWNDDLNSGMDGLQVWGCRNFFCNVKEYFQNRNSDQSLHSFLNRMYKEVYGDRLQSAYLLISFYRSKSLNRLKKNKSEQKRYLFFLLILNN